MHNSSKDRAALFSRPLPMLVLGGLFAGNAVSIDAPLVAVPGIAAHFRVDAGQAQMANVLFLLGFAFGHIPVGLLGDRYGRRPVILSGLALAAIMCFVAMLAPSFDILIIARFLQGFATCSAVLMSRAMIRDIASGNAASGLNSKAMSILSVLIIVIPLLSGYILTMGGWRAVLSVVIFYLASLFLLVLCLIPETKPASEILHHPLRQFLLSLGAFFHTRQSILASLLGAFAFATYFIFANVGASIIVDEYSLDAAWFGPLFALTAVVQFTAAMANSRLVPKFGAGTMLKVAASFCMLGVGICALWLLVGHIVPLWALVCTAACFTITHGLTLPNSLMLTLDPLPNAAGFAAAIHGMLMAGIAALGGLVVSAHYDGRVETVLGLYATFGLVTLLMFFAGRGMVIPGRG